MQLIFSDMNMPSTVTKSIFLAGPSPRNRHAWDWRKDAIKILQEINYNGTVFIPAPQNLFYNNQQNDFQWSYDNQIAWEIKGRKIADKIVFWIPRDIKGQMPGFTTNVEFGEDISSEKIVYGRPNYAEKCKYLDLKCQLEQIKVYNNLKEMLSETSKILGSGSFRQKGEVNVPLFIWKSYQFQQWYKSLLDNGNILHDINVIQTNFVSNKKHLFGFTIEPKIWLEKENRFKAKDRVHFRTDISSILAYYPQSDGSFDMVFVEEFRPSVRNKLGRVLELPGGSSFSDISFENNAIQELFEETGVKINDLKRIKFISSRQMVATQMSYINHLFCVELQFDEFQFLKQQEKNNIANGENQHEKTFVKIINSNNIQTNDFDYCNLGMIYEVLNKITSIKVSWY